MLSIIHAKDFPEKSIIEDYVNKMIKRIEQITRDGRVGIIDMYSLAWIEFR